MIVTAVSLLFGAAAGLLVQLRMPSSQNQKEQNMDYNLTDLVKEAKDIFKRENGRLKLTFVDKTVIRFEPEVGAMRDRGFR